MVSAFTEGGTVVAVWPAPFQDALRQQSVFDCQLTG
jgi:hypothetical protein